jgi:hypothetical protein
MAAPAGCAFAIRGDSGGVEERWRNAYLPRGDDHVRDDDDVVHSTLVRCLLLQDDERELGLEAEFGGLVLRRVERLQEAILVGREQNLFLIRQTGSVQMSPATATATAPATVTGKAFVWNRGRT